MYAYIKTLSSLEREKGQGQAKTGRKGVKPRKRPFLVRFIKIILQMSKRRFGSHRFFKLT